MILTMLKTHLHKSTKKSPYELSEILDWVSEEGGVFTQTIQEFNKHIEISPDFTEIISMIKKFPQEDVSFYEMIIPYIEDSVSQHPDYADHHNNLGILYSKVKRFEDAERTFKEAINTNPDYLEAHHNLFNTLRELGKNEEALKEGQYLLEKDLAYPDFYCGLGEVYISLSRLEDAHALLQKALEKNPEYAKTHFLLAEIYEKEGKGDKAMEEFQSCLDCSTSQEIYSKARQKLRRLKKESS